MDDELNLTDLLGVSPIFQLIPKQELAPLLSFSRVDPAPLDPRTYLSHASSQRRETIYKKLIEEPEEYSAAINEFCRKFSDYSAPDLDAVKFRRPVIAGLGDHVSSPNMPQLYKRMIESETTVKESSLCEVDVELDVSDIANDRLRLLQDNEDTAEHIEYYRQKNTAGRGIHVSKRDRELFSDQSYPRKRASIDKTLISSARVDQLQQLIEEYTHGDESIYRQSGGKQCLTKAALNQFRKRIQYLSRANSLTSIDLEALQQLQRLCLNSISEESSPTDGFEVSLLASSVLLVTMNTSNIDRKLRLNSYVTAVIECLSKVIAPLFSTTSASTLRPSLVIDCLEQVLYQVQFIATDEHILTKIEYMCIAAIFSNTSDRDLDEMRSSLILILVQIFKSYRSQRLFIVNEMLLNFKKLPYQKSLTRKFQLSEGSYVLFFSVFLLRLVQSFDATSSKNDITHFMSLPKSSNPDNATNVKRDSILSGIWGVYLEAANVGDYIFQFFLEHLQSSDANYKAIFQVFVDDLLALMHNPDWPGARTLVSAMVLCYSDKLLTNAVHSSLEPFVLETLGKAGAKILKMKLASPVSTPFNSNISAEEVNDLGTFHHQVLHTLHIHDSTTSTLFLPFRHFLLQSIASFAALKRSFSRNDRSMFVYSAGTHERENYSDSESAILRLIDEFFSILNKDSSPHNYSSDDQNEESSKLAYNSIILTEDLNNSYDRFISILTASLQSKKTKVSAKAIRLLSPLIELDPKLLMLPQINSSISRLLMQGSPLSRDAVIDLLGQYMFTNSELLNKYYTSVGVRADDTSIQVRKRVLKLLKQIFMQSDSMAMRSYVCIKLLKRLEDEDSSIADGAVETLRALWMHNFSAADIAKIMVKTVTNETVGKLLARFIREHILHVKNPSDFARLKSISDLTIDMILDLVDTTQQADLETAFRLVSIFTECEGSLVGQDQLIALLPYVVNQYSGTDSICLHVLKIMRLVLKDSETFRAEYISKTLDTLFEKLTKFDTREMHEGIPVIKKLSQLSHDSSRLVKATVASVRLLKQYTMDSEQNCNSSSQTTRICKLLHLVGCFGSYCDFEEDRDVFLKSNTGLRSNETVVSLIARYLLFFCETKFHDIVRLAAVRNVIYLSANNPKLFLSEAVLKVVDHEMELGSTEMKLCIVSGLTRFLEKEDDDATKRIGVGTISSSGPRDETVSFFGPTVRSFNDGVCASVVQRYMNVVLTMCTSSSNDDVEVPVLFLRLVTKLGFANPKVCVSTIIALEASPNKRVKRIASELHTDVFEKHESLADRNYLEAVKLAVSYLKSLGVTDPTSEAIFLRSVYRIISKTYLAKKKFILSLAKLFNVELQVPSLNDAVMQRDTVVFLALNLLVLNFSSLEEICLLLYHLDRAITRDGLDLADKVTLTVGSKSGEGMSIENLQLLFVYSQTVLALIYLRHLLSTAHGISPSVMEGFRPSKADVELRQKPKIINLIDFPLSDLELNTKLGNPTGFGGIFTRLVLSAKDYTV